LLVPKSFFDELAISDILQLGVEKMQLPAFGHAVNLEASILLDENDWFWTWCLTTTACV